MAHRLAAAMFCLGAAPALAAGQSNIDPAHAAAWTENTGWLNWRGNGTASGVRVHATFLSGYLWCENVGWVNLGNGWPANGTAYANVNGGDFGVNVDPPTGNLYGLAWGENIGWVNFDTRTALGGSGQQARFEYTGAGSSWNGRFRGYAWSENVGWINLDHATYYVATAQPGCHDPFADTDGDGDVDHSDFAVFQLCVTASGWPASAGCACFDRPEPSYPHGDNDVDLDDLDAFEACATAPGIPASQTCDD
jgi:hypothetical protein